MLAFWLAFCLPRISTFLLRRPYRFHPLPSLQVDIIGWAASLLTFQSDAETSCSHSSLSMLGPFPFCDTLFLPSFLGTCLPKQRRDSPRVSRGTANASDKKWEKKRLERWRQVVIHFLPCFTDESRGDKKIRREMRQEDEKMNDLPTGVEYKWANPLVNRHPSLLCALQWQKRRRCGSFTRPPRPHQIGSRKPPHPERALRPADTVAPSPMFLGRRFTWCT